MAEPTIATMLENVRTEINSRLTGGAVIRFTAFQQSIERESLATLMELERSLMQRQASSEDGGGLVTNYASFARPT